FYSKYYLISTFLMIGTLAITVLLNILLIPLYGMYGAAIASLLGATIYNLTKYIFIYLKFGYQPYGSKTFYIMALILVCAVFVHLMPEISEFAVVNLLYKGLVVSVVYLGVSWRLKLAPE